MSQNLDHSHLRILNNRGQPVGAGFLVGERLALTCAHVLGPAGKGAGVKLDFSRLPGSAVLEARVVLWNPEMDIVGLEILGDLPPDARPVQLVNAPELWGHAFRAFGFPSGYPNGVWASGCILALDANGWLQVEDTKTTGYTVQPGFSGGPLWDEQEQAVVGMVVAADSRLDVRAAYGLPVEILVKAWPELNDRQIPSNPYRGLFAFREADAALFFGREAFNERLLAAVQRQALTAVIGPSGSGKSSVVFAGLFPRLRSQDWQMIDFRLGPRPFESLAQALLPVLEPQMSETDRLVETRKLSSALQSGDVGFASVLERVIQKCQACRMLLAADQFEELYTLCPDAAERQRFIDVLLSLRTVSNWALVLTLRADFLGQALSYRPLADALQDADLKLGPMNANELRQAIEQPAALRGVRFEAGLVERILEDLANQSGALPLLEFALSELWTRQQNRRLTHAAYDAIGKVDGALSHHADQVYSHLSPAEQVLAHTVFTQLVTPGIGTEDTRRLTVRNELVPSGWELVKRLADARLVVTDRTPDGGEAAEVVHEALIRGWERLRGWMQDDRDFRNWQERLRASLRQWQANRQDSSALLRGAPLAEAEGWLAERPEAIGEAEQVYIATSIQERQAEQRRERRRWLTLVGTIAGALVLVAVVVRLAVTGQMNRWIYQPLDMADYWVTIPAGEFWMGCDQENPAGLCNDSELPRHKVTLDTYQIGRYEVTNRQYAQCVHSGACTTPSNTTYIEDQVQQHPVADVSWHQAQAYCEWVGGHLPTEAQWEKAARGGLEGTLYPWGNDPPTCELKAANGAQFGDCELSGTVPVASFSPNAYDLYDMAGNAWEWTSSLYREYPYNPDDGREDLKAEDYRVLRGGALNASKNLSSAVRLNYLPTGSNSYVGFRCARLP